MASLEQRAGRVRVFFRYGGQIFHDALPTEDESVAAGSLARLEENLQLLHRGRLEVPPCGVEIRTLTKTLRDNPPIMTS